MTPEQIKKTLRKFLIVLVCYYVLVFIGSFVIAFCFDFTQEQLHNIKTGVFVISIIYTFFLLRAWTRFIKRVKEESAQM
jgi:hypothetical protein